MFVRLLLYLLKVKFAFFWLAQVQYFSVYFAVRLRLYIGYQAATKHSKLLIKPQKHKIINMTIRKCVHACNDRSGVYNVQWFISKCQLNVNLMFSVASNSSHTVVGT